MRRPVLIAGVVVAVLVAGLLLLTRRLTGSWLPMRNAAVSEPVAITPGRGLALEFSDHPVALPAVTVTDLDGVPIDLASMRGKVVLVNFWATWCGPCREEIPTLIALQAHYGDRLQIVGLSIDTKPAAEVKQFARQFDLNYPVAIAGDEVIEKFGGVPAVPATFFVTPAGEIVQRHIGLLQPARTEHEVRALAGLPTEAKVTYVKDEGQVLLENAAYATRIPGVDLSRLSDAQREEALKRLNTEHCTCGCGLTIAQCRINDPSCDVSLPVAQKLVATVQGQTTKD